MWVHHNLRSERLLDVCPYVQPSIRSQFRYQPLLPEKSFSFISMCMFSNPHPLSVNAWIEAESPPEAACVRGVRERGRGRARGRGRR